MKPIWYVLSKKFYYESFDYFASCFYYRLKNKIYLSFLITKKSFVEDIVQKKKFNH